VRALLKGREPAKLWWVGVHLEMEMKELPKTLPSESFRASFLSQLGLPRFNDAKKAWERLEKLGCEPLFLLMDLEVYCSHVVGKRNNRRHCSGYIAEFLEANDSQAADAEKLAQRLTEDADRIERIKREPEFLQKLNLYTKGDRPNLPDEMRSYASWLNRVAAEIRDRFSLRDQPGQSIRWAADYIKSVTGEEWSREQAQ
jgi:hypothetical protein